MLALEAVEEDEEHPGFVAVFLLRRVVLLVFEELAEEFERLVPSLGVLLRFDFDQCAGCTAGCQASRPFARMYSSQDSLMLAYFDQAGRGMTQAVLLYATHLPMTNIFLFMFLTNCLHEPQIIMMTS